MSIGASRLKDRQQRRLGVTSAYWMTELAPRGFEFPIWHACVVHWWWEIARRRRGGSDLPRNEVRLQLLSPTDRCRPNDS